MQQIRVIDRPLNVNGGAVELNDDQARRRAHNLTPVDGRKNVFEVKRPIQFKVGETLGYEGEAKLPRTGVEYVDGPVEAKSPQDPSQAGASPAQSEAGAEAQSESQPAGSKKTAKKTAKKTPAGSGG